MHQGGVGVRLLGIGTPVELRGRQVFAAIEGELAVAAQLAGYAREPVEFGRDARQPLPVGVQNRTDVVDPRYVDPGKAE